MTNRIRDTCQILDPNSKIEVLGTTIGIHKDRDDSFEERLNNLQALREDLADIRAAPRQIAREHDAGFTSLTSTRLPH